MATGAEGPKAGLVPNQETDQATDAVLSTERDDDYASFAAGMFKAVPPPILQRPEPTASTSSRNRRRAAAPSRSSTRLAARASPFPVAERAQHRLMRELNFINSKSAAPDAAVTAYLDMYGEDLPDNAVEAIRAATRLGNKELSQALAAIAAESGGAQMEVA